jgi:hypothetical protein
MKFILCSKLNDLFLTVINQSFLVHEKMDNTCYGSDKLTDNKFLRRQDRK